MISIDVLVGSTKGLNQQDLDRWIANDWVRPDVAYGIRVFQEIDVARVELIRDLRDDFGVNEDALPVVLLLLDQLYDLRRHLLERVGRDPASVDQSPVDLSGETLIPPAPRRDGRQTNAC